MAHKYAYIHIRAGRYEQKLYLSIFGLICIYGIYLGMYTLLYLD